MPRLLFWLALIAVAVWCWRRLKASRPATPEATSEHAEPMVRCAQCGIHLPQRHALLSRQRWYCSQAHLPRDAAGEP
ncbi:PP0621 family protein [Pseudomonas mangiferae]|uniref:MYND finger n=1 Tax=Pseudomonas mangiferae TaxID=2593654 RepID=A0A553H313_9PSED|nr:PP0621 family protein [Pseudomonas mangiferae]TRX76142.1 hypothetical protein FM069_02835 [Pseudomonas mangiferae]